MKITSQPAQLLLTEKQTAALFGMSQRSFAAARKEVWMPRPIPFGPRLLRWSFAEVNDAIAKMPRLSTHVMPEPTQLQRGKRAAKLAATQEVSQ